jgi:hypothetical protein
MYAPQRTIPALVAAVVGILGAKKVLPNDSKENLTNTDDKNQVDVI